MAWLDSGILKMDVLINRAQSAPGGWPRGGEVDCPGATPKSDAMKLEVGISLSPFVA
jgi:hypothetical protein